MSDDKKKLSKEEKMEKAKRLTAKMNDLELDYAQLSTIAGGVTSRGMVCGSTGEGGHEHECGDCGDAGWGG